MDIFSSKTLSRTTNGYGLGVDTFLKIQPFNHSAKFFLHVWEENFGIEPIFPRQFRVLHSIPSFFFLPNRTTFAAQVSRRFPLLLRRVVATLCHRLSDCLVVHRPWRWLDRVARRKRRRRRRRRKRTARFAAEPPINRWPVLIYKPWRGKSWTRLVLFFSLSNLFFPLKSSKLETGRKLTDALAGFTDLLL